MDTWDFVRRSRLDSVSMTVLTPYRGTPFRQQLVEEGRLLHKPWSHYDTGHVVYQPAKMTVQEMEQAYDWFCRQAHSAASIVRRGLRTMAAYPLRDMPRTLISSLRTDYGCRRTYNWRNRQARQAGAEAPQ